MSAILADLTPGNLPQLKLVYKPKNEVKRCCACKRMQNVKHLNSSRRCKACAAELGRRYYLKQRDKRLKYAAARRETRRAEAREYAREYRRKNYARLVGDWKRRRDAHKEENAARARAYRKTHPDHHTQYLYAHPEKITEHNAKRAARLLANSDGTLTKQVISALYENAKHCPYCHAEFDGDATPRSPKRKSLDHILPISRGGAHSIHNVLICCRSCNTTKAAKTLEEIGIVL